ncbi:MAG: hypothetical protein JST11_10290 [Acidobacteria bacterium]|nr:hypothetical protein [Acidobacteriota bacterium]
MMKKLAIVPLFVFLAACSRQGASSAPAADLPHATVVMRDGTRVSGAVAATTPSDITINTDDGGSRTIPMKDVRRVDYGETPTTAKSAPPATAPGSGPAAGGSPEPSAPPLEPTHEDHEHATAAQVTSVTHVLEIGTEIPVRTEETIDSGKAAEGQVFAAEIARDVKDASGAVVIPRGSNAQVVIKSASKGGKIRGASDLVLDMKSVSIDGQEYRLDTAAIAQKGREGVGVNKRTGEFAGGGAAIGAIIGAIAGGGKGAAIGAGAGAGAGALGQVLTRGSIKVPAETILTFKLDGALKVVQAQ